MGQWYMMCAACAAALSCAFPQLSETTAPHARAATQRKNAKRDFVFFLILSPLPDRQQRHRDQRRQPGLNTVELDPEQPSERRGSDPEAAAERDEVVRQLRAALAGLEPEAREVILLGKIQGLT